MSRFVYYEGIKYKLVFAKAANVSWPAKEFFDSRNLAERAKLNQMFRSACDHGDFTNKTKYGDLKDGLFEFKLSQIRMPFTYCGKERGVIVVTHGFIKQQQKAPASEITRAWRIFNEDQAQFGHKLELIDGKKKK